VREDVAEAVLELEELELEELDAVLEVGEEEDSVVVGVPLELPAVGVGVCEVLLVCECDPPDPWWVR